MGPRSGSPATETLREKAIALHRRAARRGGAAAFLLLAMAAGQPSWAATVQTSHTVTVVVVKSNLSITDDAGNFSLTFNNPKTGTDSSSQVVNYRVTGNSLPNGALQGVVSAAAVSSAPGIELRGNVGTFTNNGTDGDIILHKSSAGDQAIGTTPVPMADKDATSGNQGKVLNGTVPIVWKAKATQDLPSGEYPVTLTVTLKDS